MNFFGNCIRLATSALLLSNIYTYCSDDVVMAALRRIVDGRDTLDCCGKGIADADIKLFSEVLKQNSTLTELDLSENEFGAKGAQYLSEVLQLNSTLITLNLSDNNLNDADVKKLTDAVKWRNPPIQLVLF